MGFIYKAYLDDYSNVYVCLKCSTHLSPTEMIISKSFHGAHGKAYLFDKVYNIDESTDVQDTVMTTGRHRICYIHCTCCHIQLGWKYLKAYSMDQTYKEGKYILELNRIQLTNH